jgi:hypothetical protein
MIASQEGNPTLRLLEELLKITIHDVRYQIPSACPKNERAEAKRTAEDFFKTKFYLELCDIFNLPANKVAKLVLSQKNQFVRDEEEEDELS